MEEKIEKYCPSGLNDNVLQCNQKMPKEIQIFNFKNQNKLLNEKE